MGGYRENEGILKPEVVDKVVVYLVVLCMEVYHEKRMENDL
jgi:hypothetical protein